MLYWLDCLSGVFLNYTTNMISPENKDFSDINADNSSHFQAQILDSILSEDISDTGEDLTTETISKGKLKHEMRMLQTRFLNDSTALQNTKNLSKAREDELLVSFFHGKIQLISFFELKLSQDELSYSSNCLKYNDSSWSRLLFVTVKNGIWLKTCKLNVQNFQNADKP